MIPKIIHYVWCGSAFPERYQGYIDSWRTFNPDYQFILWNETNIDFSIPMLAELYRTKKFNKVSDVVRHMALLKHGGIYLDTDFQVFRPLDRMLQYSCFYGFQCAEHESDLIGSGAIGAEPDHWFIAKVLARMLASRNSYLGVADRPTAIGPKLITTMLREEGLSTYSPEGVFVRDVFLAPWHWFYPFSMEEKFTPECVREDTLAAHFWDKSWEKYTSRPTRILRGARSIARRILAIRRLGIRRARLTGAIR